jgi:hypothetical protein
LISFDIVGIDSCGLGMNFVCDSHLSPVVVSAIAEDGAVSLNGWLRSGDQLLVLNHADVSSSSQGFVLTLNL